MIQTIGRAARNVDGRVVCMPTVSLFPWQRPWGETNRRRAKQTAYNETHGIVPQSIQKEVRDVIAAVMPAVPESGAALGKAPEMMTNGNGSVC